MPALLAMAEGKPDCVGKAKKDGSCSVTSEQEVDSSTPGGAATGKPSELPTQSQKPTPKTESGTQPTEPPGKSAEGTTQNEAPPTSQRPQDEVEVLDEVRERDRTTLGSQQGEGPGVGGTGTPGPGLGPVVGTPNGDVRTPAGPTRPLPAGIRFLTARLLGGGDLEVLVNENEVRGIDGGWAVVVDVEGGFLVPEAATATGRGGIPRQVLPSIPGGPVTLLAVTGQRSPSSYAARYRAIGQLETDARPVITITLIQ